MSFTYSLIPNLERELASNGAADRIDMIEEQISIYFKEIEKDDRFYQLPIKNILSILRKCQAHEERFLTADDCLTIAESMNRLRKEEAPLILSVLDAETNSLEQLIRIFYQFSHLPLCQRLGDVFTESRDLMLFDEDQNSTLDEKPSSDSDPQQTTPQQQQTQTNAQKQPTQARKRPLRRRNFPDIFHAIAYGRLISVKKFVEEKGVSVEQTDNYGRTPLFFAVDNNKFDIVKYLVEKGAQVDPLTKSVQTILQTAAKRGNQQIVEYLLNHGAYINRTNASGKTALFCALTQRRGDVAFYLYQHGGSLNEGKPDPIEILRLAAQYNILLPFKSLLEKYDINMKFSDGNTLLHTSSICGAYENCELLLSMGADTSIRNKAGHKASTVACTAINSNQAMKNLIKELIRGSL